MDPQSLRFLWDGLPLAAPPFAFTLPPEITIGHVFAAAGMWCGGVIAARLLWTAIGKPSGLWDPCAFGTWLRYGLPWRGPYSHILRLSRWCKTFTFGGRASSEWAGPLECMSLTFNPARDIYLGRLWLGGIRLFQPLGLRCSLGAFVVAAAGAGKTTWLMTWLGCLTHPSAKGASGFIIDCDGQMVNVLGEALQRAGHRVIRIDPYHLARIGELGRYCLIAELDAAVKRHGSREDVVRYAQTAADAIIRQDNSLQPVFSNNARAFVLGLLLYVWAFAPEDKRNLGYFRELLATGLRSGVQNEEEDPWLVLLYEMAACVNQDDGCDGKISAVIARAASIMRSGESREGKNPFRGTAIEQTAWLDEPRAAALVQGKPSFTCGDLKTSNPLIFFVAPVQDIKSQLSGFTRLLVYMTMYVFQNMPGERKPPCTLFIDELPSLGKTPLHEAPPTLRKYGLRLVCVTQSMDMLESVYGPHDSKNFIDNAACTIWMSAGPATLQYLSNLLGKCTRREKVEGSHWFYRLIGLSKIPPRYQNVERLLMDRNQLDEFLYPAARRIVVTRAGLPAIRAGHGAWYEELPTWSATVDAQHGESWLRARVRRRLGRAPEPAPVLPLPVASRKTTPETERNEVHS